MKPGDTFRAQRPMGMTNYDHVLAVFTVTKVTPSEIVYAIGDCETETGNGRPYNGLKSTGTVRFKQAYNGLVEFQPTHKTSYWTEVTQ